MHNYLRRMPLRLLLLGCIRELQTCTKMLMRYFPPPQTAGTQDGWKIGGDKRQPRAYLELYMGAVNIYLG